MISSSLNQLARQEKTRREILHKSDLVPPLPDLVTRLLGLLHQQDTEPRDLELLLQNDQVLVAKMLAMVNSPFYGLNRSVNTVKEAVMVLGFRGVRSLVLATSTAKLLQRDFGCYGHEPKGLWLHAVCVASGARSLAKRLGLPADDAEQLFVCGLLHDIGKLLLVNFVQGGVGLDPDQPAEVYERAMLGLDHAEAGAMVTQKWNLSREIQEVIRAHHDEEQGVGADAPSLHAVIVRLADAVAHEVGAGYEPGRSPGHRISAADLEAVGLQQDHWVEIRDELAANMDEAVAALGHLGG